MTAANDRLFIKALIYRYRAGIPSRDLPERFGNRKNVHRRFSRGYPVGLLLTGGQAHDLVGADYLLPDVDADKRVIEPLSEAWKGVVIPPKANRRAARD